MASFCARGEVGGTQQVGKVGPAPAGSQLSRSGERWTIPALTVATFLSALTGFAFGPFLPVIARDLGTSVTLLGQVPALAALAAAGLGLVVGPLADQIGYRRCLAIALLSLSASVLGVGVSPAFAVLLLAALLGALGRAATTPVAQAIVGSGFADDTRRRALGWMTAGISGAIVVGVPALTTIDSVLGWRAAFAGLALLTAGNAALIARILRPDPSPAAFRLRPREILAAYRPVVRHRPTLGLVAGFLLGSAGGSGAALTYLGAFLAERHGFTTQLIGLVYLAVGAAAFAGSAATGGQLGARPLRPLLIRARMLTGALVGGAFLLSPPAGAVVGLVALALLLHAVSHVATATLLTSETPAGRATTMTLNGSAAALGQAIGAGLGGVLLAGGGYAGLGWGATISFAGAAAVVWWSRPRPAATG